MSHPTERRVAAEVAVPLRTDARGRTATVGHADHVRDMVEAVLFTAPGERVNRPDFGCGLSLLLFAPVDESVISTADLQVRSGLQQWLGSVIEVDDVAVRLHESTVTVRVAYRIRATGEARTHLFERST
jgi:phage baseplate assembly protein W